MIWAAIIGGIKCLHVIYVVGLIIELITFYYFLNRHGTFLRHQIHHIERQVYLINLWSCTCTVTTSTKL